MLSVTARYALKALVFVAEREPEGASAAEISIGGAVSRKYLELVLRKLKADGLLTSRRGRGGGYRLARPAEAISMSDIIRSIDGPLALAPCASQTAFAGCADCIDVEGCRIRRVLSEGRDALAGVMDRRSLADLARLPTP